MRDYGIACLFVVALLAVACGDGSLCVPSGEAVVSVIKAYGATPRDRHKASVQMKEWGAKAVPVVRSLLQEEACGEYAVQLLSAMQDLDCPEVCHVVLEVLRGGSQLDADLAFMVLASEPSWLAGVCSARQSELCVASARHSTAHPLLFVGLCRELGDHPVLQRTLQGLERHPDAEVAREAGAALGQGEEPPWAEFPSMATTQHVLARQPIAFGASDRDPLLRVLPVRWFGGRGGWITAVPGDWRVLTEAKGEWEHLLVGDRSLHEFRCLEAQGIEMFVAIGRRNDVASSRSLMAFTRNGAVQWERLHAPTTEGLGVVHTGARPYIVVLSCGFVHVLDVAGDTMSKTSLPDVAWSLATDGQSRILVTGGGVFAYEVTPDGALRPIGFELPTGQINYQCGEVVRGEGGWLYLLGGKRHADGRGVLEARGVTGDLRWTATLSHLPQRIWTAQVRGRGSVGCVSAEGHVYLFRPDGALLLEAPTDSLGAHSWTLGFGALGEDGFFLSVGRRGTHAGGLYQLLER